MQRRLFNKVLMATLASNLVQPQLSLAENKREQSLKKGAKKMQILILTGSPREAGNSNTLANEFSKGAKEAGHEVWIFNAAQKKVNTCTACNSCNMNGPCIFDDDFNFVREHILKADLVAFVSPMYYFGISAQLKAVIDRFYAINGQIHVKKKSVLMLTFADTNMNEAKPIISHYETLLDYLGWEDTGRVIAPGVWTEGSIINTTFPKQAYNLGKQL